MRFQEISESTAGTSTAGSVATVAKPLGEVQVRGLEPAEKVMKGTAKKKGPYANSISESKKVDEAKLDEEDKIIAVGKGKKLKTGLHGKSEEPKLKGLKAPFKSQGVFVADKRGNKVCDCESEGVAQEVAKALTAYAIANEVKMQGAGVIAGGLQYESEEQVDEKAVSKAQQRFMGMAHAIQKGKKIPGASKELKAAAKGMTKKAGHDFAATKHKGLPEKVKK